MQNRGIRAVLRQIVGCTVIKAYPNGKDHIRVMHGHVGFVGTVHTQHTQRLTMRCRKRPQPHKRRDHRKIQFLCQRTQLRFAGRRDRTTAHIDNGMFRRYQRLQSTFDLPFMTVSCRVIGAHTHRIRPYIREFIRWIENIFR